MDENKLFGKNFFFRWLGVCAPWKKCGQKMKNFEIFCDIIDNHACVHMRIKKNFKIFRFLGKFLNYLKGPPLEFFLNWFFSISIHGKTKFDIDSGWVLTFGLGPVPRELCNFCISYSFTNQLWIHSVKKYYFSATIFYVKSMSYHFWFFSMPNMIWRKNPDGQKNSWIFVEKFMNFCNEIHISISFIT